MLPVCLVLAHECLSAAPTVGKLCSASVGWQGKSLWHVQWFRLAKALICWLVTPSCFYLVKGVDNIADRMWEIVRFQYVEWLSDEKKEKKKKSSWI